MKHLFLLLFLTTALFHGTPSLCDTVKDDDAEELKQAVVPIKKAAEQGDITAQYKLGVLYSRGIGMEKDNALACHWYRKAAEQGNMKAQYMLGRMYYEGEGVPQDFVKARRWWGKAAAQKNANKDNHLILCVDSACYFKVYLNGMAEYDIGELYSKGLGVRQDDDTARQWWEQSAAKGFVEAQLHLGYLYHQGKGGVGQDYGMARRWWEKAAATGNPRALTCLGTLYEHGEGVKKDLAVAGELYDTACKRGFKAACAALEEMNGQ